MRLLILGGSTFLGWFVAQQALEAGDAVTSFTRGRSGAPPEGVEALHGDRHGDLGALRGRAWDAVVDTSGYEPEVVAASAELLRAAGHYAFVSSGSAYADHSRRGLREDAPTATGDGYGGRKAACEREVLARFGDRAHVIRAGLIAGPRDYTGRATWWARRIARGGEVLVPAPADQPLQLIDVRDLADWIVACARAGTTGTMNATGRTVALQDWFDACRAAAGADARFTAVDEAWLVEQGVEPWDDLPLWLAPSLHPEFAGFLDLDVSRAFAAGLRTRPLEETAAAILADDTPRPAKDFGPPLPGEPGLAPKRERSLLAAWRTFRA